MDSRSAQVEKRARIDLLDLKEQREGEMHIFFKSKIVRAKSFFANPDPVKKMRLNQFLKVDKPLDSVLIDLSKAHKQYEKLKTTDNVFVNIKLPESDLEKIIVKFNETETKTQVPIDRAVAALLAFHQRDVPVETIEELTPDVPYSELNLFTPLRFNEHVKRYIVVKETEKFAMPFLDPLDIRTQLTKVEQMFGKTEQNAMTIGSEMIKDMQQATHYPPQNMPLESPEQLTEMVEQLIQNIVLRKSEEENSGMDEL